MAKVVRIKSELKQEKNRAFFVAVLLVLAFLCLLGLAIYMSALILLKKAEMPFGVPIGVALLSLVFLVLYFVKRKNYKILRAGVIGEKNVLNVLRKLPSSYTVVANPIINNRGKYNELDFIVASKDAIFTIETKNYKGVLQGKASDRELVQMKYGKGGAMYNKNVKNPIFQADMQGRRMRDLLYDLGITASVYPVLYFASGSIELKLVEDKPFECAIFTDEAELLSFINNTHGKTEINSADIKSLIKAIKR